MESVFAQEDLQFYCTTKEVVEDMWITRISKERTISDVPFILRRKSDNSYVYCLEPLVYLNQKEDYTPYFDNDEKLKLRKETWDRISLLAYFGYLYPGHEEKKWYGITQYLIWKTVAPDIEMYFSKNKNGEKVEAYDEEIEEIEKLIRDYQALMKLDQTNLIFKNHQEWEEYLQDNSFVSALKKQKTESIYSFELPKNEATFGADIIYYHANGQNVYHPGELSKVDVSFQVEFLKGVIHLQKKNVEGVFLSEENHLGGAKYGIYQDGILVDTMVTDQEGKASSQELEYGTYTIKELSASQGYLVDQKEYTIELNQEDYPLEVYEDQIMKTVSIQKWYGNGTYQLESNAIFEIYQKDVLVCRVETDSNGIAKFSLPYGEYRLHQVQGRDGYYKVEDYSFVIDENWLDEPIPLYNREIIPDVPDTGLFDFSTYYQSWLQSILKVLYAS